mmetsp:Transcript_17616/g.60212  ORF Transcript_17616/g.60212 Transcript_17616/m.60212 type:complete len:203 (-) Transcript_17616:201-809(-)
MYSSCRATARPKSESLHSPAWLRSRFPGLMSRWIVLRSTCSTRSARRIWRQNAASTRSGTLPAFWSAPARLPASMYSSAMVISWSSGVKKAPQKRTRPRSPPAGTSMSHLISFSICERFSRSVTRMDLRARKVCDGTCMALRTQLDAPSPMTSKGRNSLRLIRYVTSAGDAAAPSPFRPSALIRNWRSVESRSWSVPWSLTR